MPAIVLVVASLALAVMYCSNSNDDHPGERRGDGSYKPVLARGDGHMHFLITRSIVFDGDLDFDNDLHDFGDPWRQPTTVTGRKNVMQQVGPSMVWAPVLLVARGAAAIANVFGAGIETHGYTMFHQRILFTTSVIFAVLAMVLGVLLVRRLGIGKWSATWGGVAILFGTSLTYYATYMPGYAHAMDAAICAVFLARWAWTIGDLRWRRFVELGVWLGIATMVRIQDVGFGVVLAMELIGLAWKRRDVLVLARGAVTLAITAVMFVPQLYVWNAYYGSWVTTPQGPGQMRYGHPMVLELLFSARNGYFSNHPLAYLGAIGLVVGVWRGPRISPHARLVCGALLAAVAIQVYVNAVTYEWWSGASFGQRRMCSSTIANIVGLAVLVASVCGVVRRRIPRIPSRVRHGLAVIALGYFVAWNCVWVGRLRSGATAGRNDLGTCCGDMKAPMSWIADPVYRAVGNPFEFPANAYYAVKNGVDLQRWDRSVGKYPLVPGVLGYEDGSYRKATASWDWTGGGGWPWLISGFGPAQKDGAKKYRWTTSEDAVGVLPALMPEPHEVVMPIAANAEPGENVDVTIACNGAVVATAAIGAQWTTIRFLTDGTLGDNVIKVSARVKPHVGGPAAPADAGDVGVAIGPLHVGLPSVP